MEKAEKEKWETEDTFVSMTFLTPGVSQAVGFAAGATGGLLLTLDKIDDWGLHPAARVPLKFLGGGLAAVGGAAVGTVVSMPAGVYLTMGLLSEIRDNAKYKELSNKFLDMGTQMEMVGARLDTITNALEIIDEKFERSKKAEDKLLFKQKKHTDINLTKKQVAKVESTAKELIEACDVSLGLVKQEAMCRFER